MNGSGAKDGMRVSTEVTRIDGTAEGSARDGVPSPVDGKDPGDRPLTEGERRELLGRAEQGDRTVLPALMRLLDASPALWKHCGDVAREAEALWIDLIAGRDLLVRQSLRRKVADMKVELGGPAAPPMERLLVDRVVATWMQLAQADMALARLKGGEASIAQLDLMQRRQERAQRSHLAAMKTLATVRRLGVATAPAATTEAAGFNEERPRRGRKDRVRSGGVPDPGTRHSTDGDRGASDDRPGVAAGKPAKREDLVPKALRDRMKGIVGAEN